MLAVFSMPHFLLLLHWFLDKVIKNVVEFSIGNSLLLQFFLMVQQFYSRFLLLFLLNLFLDLLNFGSLCSNVLPLELLGQDVLSGAISKNYDLISILL